MTLELSGYAPGTVGLLFLGNRQSFGVEADGDGNITNTSDPAHPHDYYVLDAHANGGYTPPGTILSWTISTGPNGTGIVQSGAVTLQAASGCGGSGITLTVTPPSQTVGQYVTLLAGGAGTPATLVRFQVTSGPDTGFTAIIAADGEGSATTVVGGKAAGTDVVVAWIDANSNGAVDSDEPASTVSVVWKPLPTASAPPSRGPGAGYVALGDSYSSGEGLGPFLAGTNISCALLDRAYCAARGITNGNQCHRSSRAYPEYVLSATGTVSDTFRACSGL